MKFRVLVTLFILILTVFPALAQETDSGSSSKKFENESEYYPVFVQVEKVYNYSKGYIVVYRKGPFQMANAYLPLEWFNGASGKGEVVRQGSANTWPRLVVYYKDGELSHVRLYVHRDRNHETWGVARASKELDSKFENVENLKLEF
ncbi:MAG: hypothetical protein LBI91_08185 [Spirochaetaceae bacterium]|jgi:hypothetical protein|nr:hypothetical protein [Spirochaetaceae bacterium]